MPLAPGDKLGHYEVLSLLGQGARGEVYGAKDAKLDRRGKHVFLWIRGEGYGFVKDQLIRVSSSRV